MVSLIKNPLPFHALRHASLEIVRSAVEIDDPAHDRLGVLGRVKNARNKQRLVPAHEPGLRLQGARGSLTATSPSAERTAPLDIHGLDVSNGGYQVGNLFRSTGMMAPDTEVILGGRLFPVLDLGHFGAVPPGKSGQFPAGEPRVFPDVPQAVPKSLARLIN